MMREDHEANIEDTRRLGGKLNVDLKKTDAVDTMQSQGEKTMDKLENLKGSEFERSYLSEMVNGHRDALHQIDGWIKNAQSPELKQHLQQTRDRVQFHLKEAERLQSTVH